MYVTMWKQSYNIITDGIGLNEVFNTPQFKDPFHNLHSEYLRSKYFSEHMMLTVCESFYQQFTPLYQRGFYFIGSCLNT